MMKAFKKMYKKLKKMAKNRRGFSLTELMVAISITSMVATMSAQQMDDVLPMARDAQRKANIHQVETALHLYYADNGAYPLSNSSEPTVAGWQEMEADLEGTDPLDSYVPEVPVDPLNDATHQFKYWSNGQKFKITYETEDTLDASPVTVYGL